MLSDDELRFLQFWEENRLKEKKSYRQILIGIPAGLLVVIPILINFYAGWYKRADMWARSHSQGYLPLVIFIALFCIIAFITIFNKHHKWEMNEQFYQELKAKKQREKDAGDAAQKN